MNGRRRESQQTTRNIFVITVLVVSHEYIGTSRWNTPFCHQLLRIAPVKALHYIILRTR